MFEKSCFAESEIGFSDVQPITKLSRVLVWFFATPLSQMWFWDSFSQNLKWSWHVINVVLKMIQIIFKIWYLLCHIIWSALHQNEQGVKRSPDEHPYLTKWSSTSILDKCLFIQNSRFWDQGLACFCLQQSRKVHPCN
jgi:hypothetical protein